MWTLNAKRTRRHKADLCPGFGWFAVISLLSSGLFTRSSLAQHPKVLLNDANVLATEVEVSRQHPFTLPNSTQGTVWIALGPMSLSSKKVSTPRALHTGNAEFTDAALEFHVESDERAHLILITPKRPHQPLTVSPAFLSGGDLEDASARNATLIVSISPVRFRDICNRGDESQWLPGQPRIISLQPAHLAWIRPGIHHFHQLGRAKSDLVSIEW